MNAFGLSGPDFKKCLLASFALHAGFLLLRGVSFRSAPVDAREIDLTFGEFYGFGAAKLGAPKKLAPQATLPPAPAATPVAPKPQAEAPKQWTLPGPETKTVAPPKEEAPPATQGGAANGTGTSPLTGGEGRGFDYGVPNGTLTPGAPANIVRPKLLNRDEVLANLRKYYPERERFANHEGEVIVDIHLTADGGINGVDIVQSAGRLFDEAAIKVAHLMKFEPARTPQGPAAAKVRQKMKFSLED